MSRKQSFPTWREIRERHFSKAELRHIDDEVAQEVEIILALQENISHEAARYLADNGIGFNEFTRRLGASPRRTSQILKGECNLTMASIAQLAALFGKRARIVFE